MAFTPSMLRTAPGVAPRGVDLNLGKFNLSSHTRMAAKGGASWSEADASITLGSAFFESLEDSSKVFKKEDKKLLNSIFNPEMSDRRDEGVCFVPPDASLGYVQRLRNLVIEEDSVREKRKRHFLSTQFVIGKAGKWFPSSWTSEIEIESGKGKTIALETGVQGGELHTLPEYADSPVVQHILMSTAPVFEKSTEDGIRFCIYRLGSLEVRTTQELNGKETVGVVFSIRASASKGQQGFVKDHELIVKVTEYVATGQRRGKKNSRRSYIVLETEENNFIFTERRSDGTLVWEENPKDLEDRKSVGKVTRSEDCGKSGATVEFLKLNKNKEMSSNQSGVPTNFLPKLYARGVFFLASAVKGAAVADFGYLKLADEPEIDLGATWSGRRRPCEKVAHAEKNGAGKGAGAKCCERDFVQMQEEKLAKETMAAYFNNYFGTSPSAATSGRALTSKGQGKGRLPPYSGYKGPAR